jgi:DNA-binding NarL/FixJ family response regulator
MRESKITYIICYDDHRLFSEDVRKRFTDSSRYVVESYVSTEDFLLSLIKIREYKSCKVALLGVPDGKERYDPFNLLVSEIKKIDKETGIILISPADKIDDIRKNVIFGISDYIVRNPNSIHRIHNSVKKLFSEHNIGFYRRRRNLALYILSGFLIFAFLFFIFVRLRMSYYF